MRRPFCNGDIVRRANPYGRLPCGRFRVTGWRGPQMVRLETLDGSTRYEMTEAELAHTEDAVTRLGKLAR